jgi:hypothetical protein
MSHNESNQGVTISTPLSAFPIDGKQKKEKRDKDPRVRLT